MGRVRVSIVAIAGSKSEQDKAKAVVEEVKQRGYEASEVRGGIVIHMTTETAVAIA
jgi:hypothetical protein